MASPSLYEILGVSYYASADQIKAAFTNAVNQLERLNAPEQATRKKLIATAYVVLSDPAKRAEYNVKLSQQLSAAAAEKAKREAESSAFRQTEAKIPAGSARVEPPRPVAARNEYIPPPPASRPITESYDFSEYAPGHLRTTANFVDWTIVIAAAACLALALSRGRRDLSFGLLVTITLAPMLMGWLYFALFEGGARHATLGQRLLGLSVERGDGEGECGRLRAALRYLASGISNSFFGWLFIYFTEKKQALHDLCCDTVVVSDGESRRYWPVLLLGSVLAISGLYGVTFKKLLIPDAETMQALQTHLKSDQQFDPNRNSPDADEVRYALSAGRAMQAAVAQFQQSTGNWPAFADTEAVLALSSRAETLRNARGVVLFSGTFSISVGATRRGTARLLFMREMTADTGRWSCQAVNIAPDATPDECSEHDE
jgi:uncharacterized RDD family membrane protein YckC